MSGARPVIQKTVIYLVDGSWLIVDRSKPAGYPKDGDDEEDDRYDPPEPTDPVGAGGRGVGHGKTGQI